MQNLKYWSVLAYLGFFTTHTYILYYRFTPTTIYRYMHVRFMRTKFVHLHYRSALAAVLNIQPVIWWPLSKIMFSLAFPSVSPPFFFLLDFYFLFHVELFETLILPSYNWTYRLHSVMGNSSAFCTFQTNPAKLKNLLTASRDNKLNAQFRVNLNWHALDVKSVSLTAEAIIIQRKILSKIKSK